MTYDDYKRKFALLTGKSFTQFAALVDELINQTLITEGQTFSRDTAAWIVYEDAKTATWRAHQNA